MNITMENFLIFFHFNPHIYPLNSLKDTIKTFFHFKIVIVKFNKGVEIQSASLSLDYCQTKGIINADYILRTSIYQTTLT